MSSHDLRTQKGKSTRKTILAAARQLFGAVGYGKTSIEMVLDASGASRGSLYYHFRNKEALFRAVVESVCTSLVDRVRQVATQQNTAASQLRAGCIEWLRASRCMEVQQILLRDAPAALGWFNWRKLDEQYFLGLLHQGLTATAKSAQYPISAEHIPVLSKMLMAALSEAALLIGMETDETPIENIEASVNDLLDRLLGIDFST